LFIGGWLIRESSGRTQTDKRRTSELEKKFAERARSIKEEQRSRSAAGLPPDAVVTTITCTIKTIAYEFRGERFRFSVPVMFLLSAIVGIIGGAYGIGAGAIIASFCVAVFPLPVDTVAGNALLGTFLTSVVGVIFYSILPSARGSPRRLTGRWGSCSGSAGSEECLSGPVSKNLSPKTTSRSFPGL